MSKFKVGNFVDIIYEGTYQSSFKVKGLDTICDYSNPEVYHNIVLDGKWDSYNDEPSYTYEDMCELWIPRKDDWCWFWDNPDNLQLRKFLKMDRDLFQPYESVMGFKYCEPYFGEIPTILESV